MLTSFHDTTHLPRVERDAANVHAKRQEDRVLSWFRAFPDANFTREDVEYQFEIPTQSASRVLANLVERHALEKSAEATKVSKYGKPCHSWRLARVMPVEQGRLL